MLIERFGISRAIKLSAMIWSVFTTLYVEDLLLKRFSPLILCLYSYYVGTHGVNM